MKFGRGREGRCAITPSQRFTTLRNVRATLVFLLASLVTMTGCVDNKKKMQQAQKKRDAEKKARAQGRAGGDRLREEAPRRAALSHTARMKKVILGIVAVIALRARASADAFNADLVRLAALAERHA